MNITPLKTEIVRPKECTLWSFLDRNLLTFPEHSILAISAKIISLCGGRIADLSQDKETLIKQEADYFLPKKFRRFGASGTIIHHAFIGAAGIDKSNAGGSYVLLPKNPQRNANALFQYLKQRFGVEEIGVLITDSHSTPMRRGASGIALAYCGFKGLRDYRGTPDVFDRKLVMEQANIPDALAAAAVLVMGEGNEQTPLALIEQVPHIVWNDRVPTSRELGQFFVNLEDDIFSPLINFKRLKKLHPKTPPTKKDTLSA